MSSKRKRYGKKTKSTKINFLRRPTIKSNNFNPEDITQILDIKNEMKFELVDDTDGEGEEVYRFYVNIDQLGVIGGSIKVWIEDIINWRAPSSTSKGPSLSLERVIDLLLEYKTSLETIKNENTGTDWYEKNVWGLLKSYCEQADIYNDIFPEEELNSDEQGSEADNEVEEEGEVLSEDEGTENETEDSNAEEPRNKEVADFLKKRGAPEDTFRRYGVRVPVSTDQESFMDGKRSTSITIEMLPNRYNPPGGKPLVLDAFIYDEILQTIDRFSQTEKSARKVIGSDDEIDPDDNIKKHVFSVGKKSINDRISWIIEQDAGAGVVKKLRV